MCECVHGCLFVLRSVAGSIHVLVHEMPAWFATRCVHSVPWTLVAPGATGESYKQCHRGLLELSHEVFGFRLAPFRLYAPVPSGVVKPFLAW